MTLENPLLLLAEYLRPHNKEIALAMVATLLVIFGDTINDLVRMLVKKQHILFRLGVFIALCTFGYGALSVWLTPMLAKFLAGLSAVSYVLVIAGGFIAVGILAERYNKS